MFRRGALLGITFLLNIGSAMNDPAWQAIVPELVPLAMIPETVGEQIILCVQWGRRWPD
jgi:hypothetical protein